MPGELGRHFVTLPFRHASKECGPSNRLGRRARFGRSLQAFDHPYRHGGERHIVRVKVHFPHVFPAAGMN
jgi:hypothetical protein